MQVISVPTDTVDSSQAAHYPHYEGHPDNAKYTCPMSFWEKSELKEGSLLAINTTTEICFFKVHSFVLNTKTIEKSTE
jgi:hypothetical protein